MTSGPNLVPIVVAGSVRPMPHDPGSGPGVRQATKADAAAQKRAEIRRKAIAGER